MLSWKRCTVDLYFSYPCTEIWSKEFYVLEKEPWKSLHVFHKRSKWQYVCDRLTIYVYIVTKYERMSIMPVKLHHAVWPITSLKNSFHFFSSKFCCIIFTVSTDQWRLTTDDYWCVVDKNEISKQKARTTMCPSVSVIMWRLCYKNEMLWE